MIIYLTASRTKVYGAKRSATVKLRFGEEKHGDVSVKDTITLVLLK